MNCSLHGTIIATDTTFGDGPLSAESDENPAWIAFHSEQCSILSLLPADVYTFPTTVVAHLDRVEAVAKDKEDELSFIHAFGKDFFPINTTCRLSHATNDSHFVIVPAAVDGENHVRCTVEQDFLKACNGLIRISVANDGSSFSNSRVANFFFSFDRGKLFHNTLFWVSLIVAAVLLGVVVIVIVILLVCFVVTYRRRMYKEEGDGEEGDGEGEDGRVDLDGNQSRGANDREERDDRDDREEMKQAEESRSSTSDTSGINYNRTEQYDEDCAEQQCMFDGMAQKEILNENNKINLLGTQEKPLRLDESPFSSSSSSSSNDPFSSSTPPSSAEYFS